MSLNNLRLEVGTPTSPYQKEYLPEEQEPHFTSNYKVLATEKTASFINSSGIRPATTSPDRSSSSDLPLAMTSSFRALRLDQDLSRSPESCDEFMKIAEQTRTSGPPSIQEQSTPKPLELLTCHNCYFNSGKASKEIILDLVNAPTAMMNQVSNVIAQLRIHLGSTWRELLDIESCLISARKNSSPEVVDELEIKEIGLLKASESIIAPMKFDFLASFPTPDEIKYYVWFENEIDKKENALAPFSSNIVEGKMYMGMYNVRADFTSKGPMTLKVVMGDMMSTFQFNYAPKEKSSVVTVVVLPQMPQIAADDAKKPIGAKIMLFKDTNFN